MKIALVALGIAHIITHNVVADAIAHVVAMLLPSPSHLSACGEEDNGEGDKSNGDCDEEGDGDSGKKDGKSNKEDEGKGGKRDGDGNEEGKGGKGNGNDN